MLYTNKDSFILSAAGCGGADPDSLESIMAGNESGAAGCCFSVDLTQDGIAVLCANGGFTGADGNFYALGEYTFPELRQRHQQIITIGQAVELAKSCAAKIGITVKNPAVCAQLRIALRHADYMENAYLSGLSFAAAARLAAEHPLLHFVGELQGITQDVEDITRQARESGLFGLRVPPKAVTEALTESSHRSGLFLVTSPTGDPEELTRLHDLGVNFIETDRPDTAFRLLAAPIEEAAEEKTESENPLFSNS
jgi:glycerophosphoryl diester phosphodiesterase